MSIGTNLSEQRFRSGSGIQYCANGKVRCQAVSVLQVNRWRETYNDYETPIAQLWPECQCGNAAVDGYFVCEFHGGIVARRTGGIRSFYDVIPVDMREIVDALIENPTYIDRREDIIVMQAMVWDLLQTLGTKVGSAEAWSMVREAHIALKNGDEATAAMLLDSALSAEEDKRDIRAEIRDTEKVLKDLTKTQVSTAKELRLMATSEQILALLNNIQNLIRDSGAKYIDDSEALNEFYTDIAAGIRRFANLSHVVTSRQLDSGE